MPSKNVIEFSIKVIDLASNKIRGIGDRLVGMTKRVARAAAQLTAAFAAAGAALFGMVSKITQSYDELDKLSTRLGVSVEALSQLQFIAERSGISFRNMTLALQRMGRRISEASVGMGEAQVALEELNLSAADLNKLSLDEQFKVILTALDKTTNQADRLRLAFKLFDSEGVSVLQTLDEGIEGFNGMAKEARDLGAVIGRDAVDAAKKFQDSMANLRGAFRGLGQNLADDVIPALTNFVNWIATNIPLGVALAKQAIISLRIAFVDSLATIIERLEVLARNIAIFWTSFDQDKATEWFKRAEGFRAMADELRDLSLAYVDAEFAARTFTDTVRKGQSSGAATGLEGSNEVGGFFGGEIDLLDPKEYAPKLRKWKLEWEDTMNFTKDAAESAARNIQTAFADFLFDPFEKGLKGMLKSFLDVIRRMIAEMLAFKILSNIPFFGGFFGGGPTVPRIVPRAEGGPVTRNQPFLVGERGPELFVPNASGRIMSNRDTSSMGGQPQFNTHIDARGADPGLIARLPQIMEQRDRQLMLKMQRYFETGHVML